MHYVHCVRISLVTRKADYSNGKDDQSAHSASPRSKWPGGPQPVRWSGTMMLVLGVIVNIAHFQWEQRRKGFQLYQSPGERTALQDLRPLKLRAVVFISFPPDHSRLRSVDLWWHSKNKRTAVKNWDVCRKDLLALRNSDRFRVNYNNK